MGGSVVLSDVIGRSNWRKSVGSFLALKHILIPASVPHVSVIYKEVQL